MNAKKMNECQKKFDPVAVVAPNFDVLIFLLELGDLKYSVRRFRGFLTIVFSKTVRAVEVEVLGSEIICSSSDNGGGWMICHFSIIFKSILFFVN